MDDDGIVRRAAFNLKNSGDGRRIQRVRGQPINRFRRQRNDFAGAGAIPSRGARLLEKAPACELKEFPFSLCPGIILIPALIVTFNF